MSYLQNMPEPVRAQLAISVGRAYVNPLDHSDDQELVWDLASMLLDDASALVRGALAAEIRNCDSISEAVAEKIARDVDDIAVPFIEASPVLTDDFLAQLVEECSEAARTAVAGRPHVSDAVSYSIVSHGGSSSAERLLGNTGATCSNRTYLAALERFDDCEGVLSGMASRANLTLIIIDMLVEKISSEASKVLVNRYGLAADLADYLQAQAHRKAFQKAIEGASEGAIDSYLMQQHFKGQIGPDLLSYFLESGRQSLFCNALALCAGESEADVNAFLKDSQISSLRILLNKTTFEDGAKALISTGFIEHFGANASEPSTKH